LNRVAAVASSVESSSHPASHAIDGNSSTRWSSAFSDPQWLQVDLGAVKHVSRVKLTWEAAASANYDIQVSNDNATWTTIFTDTHANGGTDDITGLSATGRYVRMYSRARTTTYGNSLFEVEVFGDSNQACNPVLGERLETGAPSATSSSCSIGPAPGRLGALASVLGSIGALGVAWRRSRRRLARRAQGATRRT
jgi:hypothetical protein